MESVCLVYRGIILESIQDFISLDNASIVFEDRKKNFKVGITIPVIKDSNDTISFEDEQKNNYTMHLLMKYNKKTSGITTKDINIIVYIYKDTDILFTRNFSIHFLHLCELSSTALNSLVKAVFHEVLVKYNISLALPVEIKPNYGLRDADLLNRTEHLLQRMLDLDLQFDVDTLESMKAEVNKLLEKIKRNKV